MSHQFFNLHTRPSLPVLIQPQSSIALSGLRVLLDQRGWPRATIMEGPAHDDGNRLALYITAEFEEPSELPLSKRGTEWLHLAKAHHDLQRGKDTSLAGSPRFGNDPPDFQLAQHSEVVSVELAQFTQSHRRRALGLLRGVKQAIIDAPRTHFEHLRHRLVLIGFADPRGLPPRSKDRSAIQTILDTLRSTDPGPSPATLPETINPHGFHVSLKNSPLGKGESACFPLPLLPQSELAQTCGFEIAASLTVIIRAGDTELELAKLTADHDNLSNDILLISAGAPAGGDGFPLIGDEIAVEPEIIQTISLPTPRHLKRILLHRWSFGDVYELFPQYTRIVESEVPSSGPSVVPVGEVPYWSWNADCPCSSRKPFRACHGLTAAAK